MKRLLIVYILLISLGQIFAQSFEPNYEEDDIPSYTLPELLVFQDGRKVKDAKQWQNKRRNEVKTLFEEQMFGKVPDQKLKVKSKVLSVDEKSLNGTALRKEVSISFKAKGKKLSMNMLIYLPTKAEGSVAVFLGYNFYGNHSIHADPGITLNSNWMRENKDYGFINNRATEASRGVRASRWPVAQIIGRGYGLAVIYYGDVDPDFDDDFQNGIQPLFYKKGEDKPAADEWGSIAAWAWALSRAMDYLETDEDIDPKKVAVIGHSRLGKTSLWAGAMDERFAMVISNDSGCGGAALSRRRIGETVGRINRVFPHWFCDNFTQYNENEDALPIDQHGLIALMAPRPVYVASATEDRWADPKGEFLSALYANPVYQLFGLRGLPTQEMPAADQQVMGHIGYHIRTGQHDLTSFDWEMYMNFADKHYRK